MSKYYTICNDLGDKEVLNILQEAFYIKNLKPLFLIEKPTRPKHF